MRRFYLARLKFNVCLHVAFERAEQCGEADFAGQFAGAASEQFAVTHEWTRGFAREAFGGGGALGQRQTTGAVGGWQAEQSERACTPIPQQTLAATSAAHATQKVPRLVETTSSFLMFSSFFLLLAISSHFR